MNNKTVRIKLTRQLKVKKFQKLFEAKDRITPYDHVRVYVVDNFIHASGKVVEEEEFLEAKEKLLDMIGRFQCQLVILIQTCTTETHLAKYNRKTT